MQHAADMKGKIGEYLRQALGTLPLSQNLATIRADLDLDDLQLKREPVDEAALRQFLQHNDFNSWLQELGDDESPQAVTSVVNYTTVLDQATLETWLGKLHKAELIAFDTETTSLDPMQAELVGLSFAVSEFEAIYIPVVA